MDEFDFNEHSDEDTSQPKRFFTEPTASQGSSCLSSSTETSAVSSSLATHSQSTSTVSSKSSSSLRSSLAIARRMRMERAREFREQSPQRRVHFSASPDSTPETNRFTASQTSTSSQPMQASQDTFVSTLSGESTKSATSLSSSSRNSYSVSVSSRGASSKSSSLTNPSRSSSSSTGSSIRDSQSSSSSSPSRKHRLPSTTRPRRRPTSVRSSFLRDVDEVQFSSKKAVRPKDPPSYNKGIASGDPNVLRRRLLGNGMRGARSIAGSNNELLHDDCLFLCQAIVQSKASASATTLRTVSDLVLLLSLQKNRQLLFLNEENQVDNSALRALLDVFASCNGVGMDASNGDEDQISCAPSTKVTSAVSVASRSTAASKATSIGESIGTTNNKYDSQVLQAISMALYFLSLDCTLSEQGAPAANATKARRIRHQVLKHPHAIAGILSLVVASPLLTSLRGDTEHKDTPPSSGNPLSSPVPSVRVVLNKKIGRTSNGLSRDDCSVTSSIADSPMSSQSTGARSPDPTKAGRLRRKKRLFSAHGKETVPASLEQPKFDKDKADEFSFESFSDELPSSQSVCSKFDQAKNGTLCKRSTIAKPAGDSLAAIPENDDTMSFAASSQSTSLSFSQSVASKDPTKAGRVRRKKRRLAVLQKKGPEGGLPSVHEDKKAKLDDSDLLSTTSLDSQAMKTRENLERASTRIMSSMPSQMTTGEETRHTCQNRVLCESSSGIMESVHSIPVLALSRILSGKMEWSEKSCLDEVALNGSSNASPPPGKGEEDDEESNPLLLTNQLLGENGGIPILSQALAETHAAVIHQLRRFTMKDITGSFPCQSCLSFLHERVSSLTSLVDGACLLNASNRRELCLDGFTNETGGYLVVGLISVLQSLIKQEKLFQDTEDGEIWAEIGLECLRALTSLTHENPTAAKELEAPLSDGEAGLSVLTEVLYRAILHRKVQGKDSKLRYDSIIFCLNSLTNCVESSEGTAVILGSTKLQCSLGRAGNSMFLTWLTAWLVEETESFRDAVLDSTFGSQDSKHLERRLEKHEEDGLVTAGNGFVLLVCLLIHRDDRSDNTLKTKSPQELILAELPGVSIESKLTFVKNTLTAFCNFYHFSIGDLSIAVTKPVKKLIADMQDMLGVHK